MPVQAREERKLTTVFYADVVGYSRLAGNDEIGTHRAVMQVLDLARDEIISKGGAVLNYAGDAILAEFPSVVACINAAVTIQEKIMELMKDTPADRRVLFRIGVNIGEVLLDRGEIYGDGVNIAARLESLAPPGGMCISSHVMEQIKGKVRAEFAYAGSHKLKNISRPMEVWCWPADKAKKLQRASKQATKLITASVLTTVVIIIAGLFIWFQSDDSTLPTGPRIAVIPFEAPSVDPENAYFSDGLTKDINAHLSKFTNLFVLAPGSVAEYRGQADCGAIREALSVDYILEGSVRRSEDRLRVTTTLTDAKTCRQLDSPGPYDRDLNADDVLDIQLEIATKVAAAVGSADAPLFNANVQSAIRHQAPDILESYDCVLLSYWFYENFEPDRHRRARSCLEGAIESDPNYSLAWSRLAFSYIESKKYTINTPSDWAEQARVAANHAIDLDPSNPDAHYALAILTQMTSQELPEFQQFAHKAVELNPNDAFVLADLGTWMGYGGQWEKGKEWVSRSMTLNPKHQSWLWQIWHLDYFLNGEYAKSRDMALRMNLPKNYMVQASLTAAYAMNGEQDKAETNLKHLLQIRPDYPKNPRAPFESRGMPEPLIEGLMEGLRRAGLEVSSKG